MSERHMSADRRQAPDDAGHDMLLQLVADLIRGSGRLARSPAVVLDEELKASLTEDGSSVRPDTLIGRMSDADFSALRDHCVLLGDLWGGRVARIADVARAMAADDALLEAYRDYHETLIGPPGASCRDVACGLRGLMPRNAPVQNPLVVLRCLERAGHGVDDLVDEYARMSYELWGHAARAASEPLLMAMLLRPDRGASCLTALRRLEELRREVLG